MNHAAGGGPKAGGSKEGMEKIKRLVLALGLKLLVPHLLRALRLILKNEPFSFLV